ncbi:MAG: hypothetical protein VYA34_04465 [Myxococcota bacterium]|nr:hypothetical protein [Myxococcota bacterium]
MSRIKFLSGDLTGLDGLSKADLVVFGANDSRPFEGVAGYVDWRLCGRLADLRLKNSFYGNQGEQVLLPCTTLSSLFRVFVFGVGASRGLRKSRVVHVVEKALRVLEQASAQQCYWAAPSIFDAPKLTDMFIESIGSASHCSSPRLLIDPSTHGHLLTD